MQDCKTCVAHVSSEQGNTIEEVFGSRRRKTLLTFDHVVASIKFKRNFPTRQWVLKNAKNSCRIVLVDIVGSTKRNEKRLKEKIYKKTHEKILLHDR